MNTKKQLEALENAIDACITANAARGNGYESREYYEASIARSDALLEVADAFGVASLQQAMDIVVACRKYAARQMRKAEECQ